MPPHAAYRRSALEPDRNSPACRASLPSLYPGGLTFRFVHATLEPSMHLNCLAPYATDYDDCVVVGGSDGLEDNVDLVEVGRAHDPRARCRHQPKIPGLDVKLTSVPWCDLASAFDHLAEHDTSVAGKRRLQPSWASMTRHSSAWSFKSAMSWDNGSNMDA